MARRATKSDENRLESNLTHPHLYVAHRAYYHETPDGMLEVFQTRHFLESAVMAALATGFLYLVSRLKGIRPERILANLPRRSTVVTATLAAMLLPVGLRLALLPWRPEPAPLTHDEFGHLLVADTLLHGRFANPPHALSRHLDTIYVIQHPAYASNYPIGQGLLLAAGKKFLGDPWFGVVFASAMMCGAIAWVLFELLPWKWAAAGVLPVAFTYSLQWVSSYWGGSFCAFGGAIFFGALLRLRKGPSVGLALVAALGWSTVWLIRPFESIPLLALLWGSIAALFIRAYRGRTDWIPALLVLVFVQACTGMATLIHNRAVTGSFMKLPYVLNQEQSGVPQSLGFGPALPPPVFRFPEMKAVYLWQLRQKQLGFLSRAHNSVRKIWDFFVAPWFVLPMIAALFAIRERRVRIAWGLLLCAAASGIAYPFFFPHYIAAYSCVLAFLIVRGLIGVSAWSLSGRPVGHWLALFIVLGGVLDESLDITSLQDILSGRHAASAVNSRPYIANLLQSEGGAHVVFVRYGPDHTFHNEWVYNAADVDAAPVVWCRWFGRPDDSEVMRYYPNRQFWIVDVGESRIAANFSRYPPQSGTTLK